MKEGQTACRHRIRHTAAKLGAFYRKLRRKAHLNQAKAAAKAEVSRTTLSQFENGKRPNTGILLVEKLAHSLGLSLLAFLALADQSEPPEDPSP